MRLVEEGVRLLSSFSLDGVLLIDLDPSNTTIEFEGFRNQTVGRYANRLPSGTIHNEFQLDLIANEGTGKICYRTIHAS